jgi:hypothetical protein
MNQNNFRNEEEADVSFDPSITHTSEPANEPRENSYETPQPFTNDPENAYKGDVSPDPPPSENL